MVTCVHGALAASPHVAKIATNSDPRRNALTLKNAPSPRIKSMVVAIEPRRGTPRQLVVEYSLTAGKMSEDDMMGATDDTPAVVEMSMQLLSDVRARCAPTASGAPACTSTDREQSGRCALGL